MAAGDAALKLVIDIVANDLASGIIGQVAKSLTTMAGGGAMGAVAAAGVVAAGAVIGIGVASVKAAGNFEAGMTKVKNLAAPATENIDAMGKSLLKIAADTGQTPQHLADGLYLVESAGIHGSAALDLLSQASKAAAVGNTDMSVIADAATTAVTNFGKSGLTTGKAIDVMTATVSAGKMQYSDYAKSLSTLTVNAANGKVGFTEANAALATFTRTGQSSQLAAQHLGALFLYLGTQTVKMSDNAKKLGISFDANAFSAMSLGDKVAYLNKITGGNFAEVQKLMGGNKTLATTWATLANNSAAYSDILKQLNNSAGATDKAFATLQGDFNFQMQRMQTAFQVLLIAIGEKLLPLVTPFIKFLADLAGGISQLLMSSDKAAGVLSGLGKILGNMGDALKPITDAIKAVAGAIGGLIGIIADKLQPLFAAIGAGLTKVGEALSSFGKWLASSRDGANLLVAALTGVAVALTAAVMPAIIAFVTTTLPALLAGIVAWAAGMATVAIETLIAIAPYAAIAAVVAVAVFAILEVIQHWGEIVAWLTEKWGAFSKWFQDLLKGIGKFFSDFWQNDVVKPAQAAWKAVQTAWASVVNFFAGLIDGTKKAFESAWAWIVKAAQDTWQAISSAASTAWKIIVDIVTGAINGVVSAFKWLYEHNYYIKDLVDFIKSAFQTGLNWVQSAWSASSKWLETLWKDLSKKASDAFGSTMSFVQQKTSDGIKVTQSAWDAVSKWLSDRWTWLSKTASDIWSSISKTVSQWSSDAAKFISDKWTEATQWIHQTWNNIIQWLNSKLSALADWAKATMKAAQDAFSKFWETYVSKPFEDFWHKVTSWFSDRVKDVQKFGENLMKGLADGIKNGVGAVGDALHNALSWALGSLGFHNIPGFAGGVTNFAGGWAVVGERGPELLFLPSGSSVIPSGSPPPVEYGSSSSSSAQAMIIYNILDGKQISKVVTTYQQRELRLQGNIKSA